MTSSRIVILILVGTAGVGSAIGLSRLNRGEPLRAVDAMVDGTLVTVRAPEAGMLRLEKVAKGQTIRAGDTIGWLEPPQEDIEVTAPSPLPFGLRGGFSRPIVMPNRTREERLAAASARLQMLERKLASLPKTTQVSRAVEQPEPDLAAYQLAVQSAQHEVDAASDLEANARKAHDKAAYLYGEGAIARKEVEKAAETLSRATGELQAARNRLEKAQAALHDAEQPRTQTEVVETPASDGQERANLTAEIAATKDLISRLKMTPSTVSRVISGRSIAGPVGNLPLKPFVPEELVSAPRGSKLASPASGIVWSCLGQDSASVHGNQELLKILLTNDVWIQASFLQADAAKLRIGAPVIVRYEHGTAQGLVESIGAEPFWSSVSCQAARTTDGVIPVKIKVAPKGLPQPGTRVSVELDQP